MGMDLTMFPANRMGAMVLGGGMGAVVVPATILGLPRYPVPAPASVMEEGKITVACSITMVIPEICGLQMLLMARATLCCLGIAL